uniref:Uncharacterized protein n=1 Tax=Siphoviridae sp. cty3u30 TaxID=2825744 RepID=A0A8S5Q7Q5_9CAUD|nr:MAG TPA: hypothetical protein [Siphoviridae sp. cty3u30]
MAALSMLRQGEGPPAESRDQGTIVDGLLQGLRARIHREYRRVPVPECLRHMIRESGLCRRRFFVLPGGDSP